MIELGHDELGWPCAAVQGAGGRGAPLEPAGPRFNSTTPNTTNTAEPEALR